MSASILRLFLTISLALVSPEAASAAGGMSVEPQEKFIGLEISSTRHPFHVRCDSIDWDVVSVSIDGVSVDADRFSCRGTEAPPPLGDIVYVIGGPYQSLREFPDPYVVSAVVAGFDIYVPRYSGTFGNSIAVRESLTVENTAGGGELEVAAREVALLSKFLSTYDNGIDRRVILLAESAGSYIAAFSCSDFCPSSIALISPLMQSPIDFWENFGKSAALSGEEWFKDNGSDPGNGERRLQAARLASIGFYGQRNWTTDLCGAFARSPSPRDVRVFYGDQDPRIGVGKVQELLDGCGVTHFDVSSYPDNRHAVLQTSSNGEFSLICWLKGQAGVHDSLCDERKRVAGG